MNYSFSTSYDKEKGYLKGNDNQRVMLNLTTSAKLTKNLTFDVSLNTVFTKKEIYPCFYSFYCIRTHFTFRI